MEKLVIESETRKEKGKGNAKRLRQKGCIPAVVYDENGKSTMLSVKSAEFNKVWRSITKTTKIGLRVDGGKVLDALIKDTEYDIKTDSVLHADFFVPSPSRKNVFTMKVHLEGTPQGVLKGGFLLKKLKEIKIRADINSLPERIVGDVSSLNIGDALKVKDLSLGKGVEVLSEGEKVLCSVRAPR